MGYCVEISSTAAISNPKSFLTRCLKTGIVTLTFCTQSIDTLKMQAFPVNGKSVVCWNGLILGTATVLLAVIPVLVVAGANTGFGLAEGAAVFLRHPPSTIGGLAILSYGETSFTDRIANGQFFRALCTALV